MLDKPPTAKLELDQVMGPGAPPPSLQGPAPLAMPRDVLCRAHFFIKQEIIRLVWSKGPIEFDGMLIWIYPHVSSQTRPMRGLLHPLLDKIREAEATYR